MKTLVAFAIKIVIFLFLVRLAFDLTPKIVGRLLDSAEIQVGRLADTWSTSVKGSLSPEEQESSKDPAKEN